MQSQTKIRQTKWKNWLCAGFFKVFGSFFDAKSSFENRIFSDVDCLFEAQQRTRAGKNLVEDNECE